MKREYKIIILAILFGLLAWVIEAAVDYLLFAKGSFFGLLIFDLSERQVYIRLTVLLLFLAFGIIVSKVLARRKEIQNELEESEEKLKLLYETGKKLTSITSKEKLLPWIASRTTKLLDADECNYRLAVGDYLVRGGGFGGDFGSGVAMEKDRVKIGESLSGFIAKKNRPLLIPDGFYNDKRIIPEHREKVAKYGFRSFIGVPMRIEKKVVGVIMASSKEPEKFSKKDIEILFSFADHAALALENAKMTQRLNETNKKLKYLSYVDELTNVPNRRYFDEFYNRAWRHAMRYSKPLSVVMIDIDFFKQYNDTYGHQKGDDCLRKVAESLEATLRRPGDFVARYGGEEFVAVISDTDKDSARALTEEMRSSVEALGIKHKSSKAGDRVTISLGVATAVPKRHSSGEPLINKADKMLYQAKHKGRNKVCMAK